MLTSVSCHWWVHRYLVLYIYVFKIFNNFERNKQKASKQEAIYWHKPIPSYGYFILFFTLNLENEVFLSDDLVGDGGGNEASQRKEGRVASRQQTSAAVRAAPGQDSGHVAGMFNTSDLCKQCPRLVNVLGSAHTCLLRPSPHGPVKVGMLGEHSPGQLADMPSVPVDISFKPPPSLDANARFFFSSAITHGKNFLYKMMNFPTISRLFCELGPFLFFQSHFVPLVHSHFQAANRNFVVFVEQSFLSLPRGRPALEDVWTNRVLMSHLQNRL